MMGDKRKTPKGNVKQEKVVLEKIGHHVEIYGPYTKRGLRRLLLSSPSLYPDKDDERLQKSKYDFSRTDDEEKSGDRSKKSKEYIGKKYSKQFMIDFYEIGKDKKKIGKENAKESFTNFLKQKGISEDLLAQLLKNGLTEETIRLLKSLGFSVEDIENLQKLWQSHLSELEDHECSKSEVSEPSSSDEYMSLDSLYLKCYVSVPIKKALREIIMKKPKDPVEFLGQWLLNLKVCEEREKKRKECEMELTVEREKLKLKKAELETNYPNENDDDEKEEELEVTWNFSEGIGI